MLHCRARYVADGMVLGTKSFLNDTFQLTRTWFGPRCKDGARKIRGVDTELHTMRALQVQPLE